MDKHRFAGCQEFYDSTCEMSDEIDRCFVFKGGSYDKPPGYEVLPEKYAEAARVLSKCDECEHFEEAKPSQPIDDSRDVAPLPKVKPKKEDQ